MILDGGLGVELERRGFAYQTALWSGEAVLRAPDLLVAVHRAFLDAGAQVISTATYQLSHAGLRALGYDDHAIDEVFARAVGLACEAIAAHRAETGATDRLVAGSLGPYGATLGEGGEYSGAQHLAPDALYAFHVERSRSVARAAPDIFLFETIPSRAEGLVVADIAGDLGLRNVWISFTCVDDAFTFAGDRIEDVATELDARTAVDVIGVNCTASGAIAPLARGLRLATDKPIVVCPNIGGHRENAEHALAGDETEAAFLAAVPDWLDVGVTHIGGCCGAGPDTIRALVHAVGETAPEVTRRPVDPVRPVPGEETDAAMRQLSPAIGTT
jgi:homocysteine S-methyltransferase